MHRYLVFDYPSVAAADDRDIIQEVRRPHDLAPADAPTAQASFASTTASSSPLLASGIGTQSYPSQCSISIEPWESDCPE